MIHVSADQNRVILYAQDAGLRLEMHHQSAKILARKMRLAMERPGEFDHVANVAIKNDGEQLALVDIRSGKFVRLPLAAVSGDQVISPADLVAHAIRTKALEAEANEQADRIADDNAMLLRTPLGAFVGISNRRDILRESWRRAEHIKQFPGSVEPKRLVGLPSIKQGAPPQ